MTIHSQLRHTNFCKNTFFDLLHLITSLVDRCPLKVQKIFLSQNNKNELLLHYQYAIKYSSADSIKLLQSVLKEEKSNTYKKTFLIQDIIVENSPYLVVSDTRVSQDSQSLFLTLRFPSENSFNSPMYPLFIETLTKIIRAFPVYSEQTITAN